MRKHLSRPMQNLLRQVEKRLAEQGFDPKLYTLFEACYTDTLEKTVKLLPDGTAYVVTGDIPAMWLRDSAAQARPYLLLAKAEEETGALLEGIVRRQFVYICADPYANAFNETENGNRWAEDDTEQCGLVWERKFEVDSLCYPVQLAYLLWKEAGRTGQFDGTFVKGLEQILGVFETEQAHEERSHYRFSRKDTYFTDTLSRGGKGALVRSDTGLIWSGFRPSDDACVYGYLIPSNMFAAVILEYMEEILAFLLKQKERETAGTLQEEGLGSVTDGTLPEKALESVTAAKLQELASRAGRLKEKVRRAVETLGVVKTEAFGEIYAYETDGFGQYYLMDDANVPSLLSMSELGYRPERQEVAENTRRFLLSEANPYYFRGKAACGVGSPHTPPGYIWPIALAVQGLTAETQEEQRKMLELLAATDAGCGMMHEGFHADDPSRYTREWFSWANAMYCRLVLRCCGLE